MPQLGQVIFRRPVDGPRCFFFTHSLSGDFLHGPFSRPCVPGSAHVASQPRGPPRTARSNSPVRPAVPMRVVSYVAPPRTADSSSFTVPCPSTTTVLPSQMQAGGASFASTPQTPYRQGEHIHSCLLSVVSVFARVFVWPCGRPPSDGNQFRGGVAA